MSTRKRTRFAINFPSDLASTSGESVNSSSYVDNGDCDRVCEFCNALFWIDECVASVSTNQRPRYNQCCKGGRVALPYPRRPYTSIIHLYQQANFMENIRVYNSAFSMTSFGAKVDDSINQGTAPYVFKIAGQVHHWIGSLCPPTHERPHFLQMYIYDTANEISNRLQSFTTDIISRLQSETICLILSVLESCNELVKLFRTARDQCLSTTAPSFNICLYGSQNELCYDKPSTGSIGAIVSDSDPMCTQFDMIICYKDGRPQRINKLNSLYMALRYPLLFPFGDRGWSSNLFLHTNTGLREKLTINKYYSYQLHDRFNLYTLLLRGGRLLQQFIVDAYVCIKESRLDYIRRNQSELRTEFLQGIHDAVERGDTEGREIGKRIHLPSSFDALAICRVHGTVSMQQLSMHQGLRM